MGRKLRPAAPASFEVAVLPDAEALAAAAADEFARSAAGAIRQRRFFDVALSGGSTPRALYRRLARQPHRDAVRWDRVRFFFGDERSVSPDAERSNFGMAHDELFRPLRIPMRRVFRIPGEAEPARAARAYEKTLRSRLSGRPPRFDLVLLGLGEDGHTASLFPGTAALTEDRRLVVENAQPATGEPRVTLTLRAINAARRVIFLVAGREKASIASKIIKKRRGYRGLPAAMVSPRRGTLLWLLDETAASDF